MIFLALAVGAVFLDPNKLTWLQAIADIHHGQSYTIGITATLMAEYPDGGVTYFSFVREIIQFGVAALAFLAASKQTLQANGFSFEPIKEVAFLFIGIFLTMQPALEMIKAQAISGALFGLPLNPTTFYFGTGVLSGVLDNAPTFLSFLAGIKGKAHMTAAEISTAIQAGTLSPEAVTALTDLIQGQIATATDPQQVATLRAHLAALQASGGAEEKAVLLSHELTAAAVVSVFWGAMKYIGSGPNFMVKSIAESARDENGERVVECPSFFGYILGYSIPFLVPVLLVVWLVHFSGWVF